MLSEDIRSQCDSVSLFKALSFGGLIGGGILAVAGIAGAIISSRNISTGSPKTLSPEEKLVKETGKLYIPIVVVILSVIAFSGFAVFVGSFNIVLLVIGIGIVVIVIIIIRKYVKARSEFRKNYKPKL